MEYNGQRYFQRLAGVATTGDAREESFYSALEDLLRDVAKATGRAHVHVTTLPKRAAENPFHIVDPSVTC